MRYVKSLVLGILFMLFISLTVHAENRTILFGEFPQTRVTNSVIKEELKNLVPDSNSDVYYKGERYKVVSKWGKEWYKYEPIQWTVFNQNDGAAYLMSDAILYGLNWKTNAWCVSVKWSESDLRKWLNEDFYNMAFTQAEKKCIFKTNVESCLSNGKEWTADYVFVPSEEELTQFGVYSSGKLIGNKTEYAGRDDYYLRCQRDWLGYQAPKVIRGNGDKGYDMPNAFFGVRPCIRVHYSNAVKVENEKENANTKDISKASVTLSASSYTYDGKVKKPSVTVVYAGKKLSASDYSITYKNNLYAGIATVEVTGKGNYSGTVKKNFTITAGKKITVVINGNGGSVSKKQITVNFGGKYGTLPVAKYKGYKFLGWFTAKTGGKKITELSYVETSKKHTLYAQWKKETYTITYVLNGGTNSKKNPSSYNVSTKTFSFSNPSRTGYVFKGWYTDSKYQKSIKKVSRGTTGNMTLYAKWSAIAYSVEFDGNGVAVGKMAPMNSLKYDLCYKLKKNTYKAPNGKQFKGWNTKKDGSGQSYKDQETIMNLKDKNGTKIKLYAQWEPMRYEIKYVLNGGENNSNNVTDFNVSEKREIRNGNRTGYIFAGWYTNADFTGKAVTNVSQLPARAVVLYAKWNPITYTIKFDGNGKTSDIPEPLKCQYDTDYTIPGSGVKGFRYWSVNNDGSGTPIYAGTSVRNLKSQNGTTITLYANVRNELVFTDYSAGVHQGSVRYVSQISNLEANGWGNYQGIAKNECGYASQSMALSYIGIHASPGYLCEGERYGRWTTGFGTSYTYGLDGVKVAPGSGNVGGNASVQLINRFYSAYESDDYKGDVSPVIVHYCLGTTMHTIILVGRETDHYLALDPAKGKQMVKVRFTSDGQVTGEVTYANLSLYVDAVQQYQRIN